MKPLCIDLFRGLGGWTEGFLEEGYRVVGFDIEQRPYPGQLVLQDIRTLHGAQLRDAAVIVASPPCQEFSYRAMPWKRAKALGPPVLGIELFWQAWRIQHEAEEASGREIPLIVENVKGAQPWVGSAQWHYGSFYLWGDLPALMPIGRTMKNSGGSWFGQRDGKALERNDPRDMRRTGNNHPGKSLDGIKNYGGSWFAVAHNKASGIGRNPVNRQDGDGTKQGGNWWHDPNSLTRRFSSRSSARKAASAAIAKIPFPLAQHIARCFKPEEIAA